MFLGDVHAKFGEAIKIADRHKNRTVIQVGDLGLGFTNNPNPKFPDNFRFIRGNHDDPALCRAHPNYLGDYGYVPELDLFYLGGAWSIDYHLRTEGVSWWRDEELNSKQLNDAFDLYSKVHPKFVVTHDGPLFLYAGLTNTGKLFPDGKYSTPTALEHFWEFWQPKYWLFGHHHKSFQTQEKGTTFICLKELEKCELSTED